MKNKFFTTILFLVSSTAVMAQETGPVAQKASETLPKIMTDPLNFIIAFSFLVMIGAILVLMRVIRILTDELAPKKIVTPEPGQVTEAAVKKPSFWSKLGQSFNDAVPVEKEADVLLDQPATLVEIWILSYHHICCDLYGRLSCCRSRKCSVR
jgi:hypothetical protein